MKTAALNYSQLSAQRRRLRLDFSLNGWVFLSLMLFMGLAAVNSQANLLFGFFGLMIGVLIVSVSISRMVMRRVDIGRVLPEHLTVGRPVTINYQISNHKRFWPTLSLSLAELDGTEGFTRQPLAYLLHVGPGMTATIPASIVPKRRGLYTLNEYQVWTSFPFGFVRRSMLRQQQEGVLIYPALGKVDPRLLAQFTAAEKSGAMIRPKRGGQDEFYGLKEYRQGENPRWIHWKRSAHTGTLVTREMTLVSPPRLVLLVDTCCPNPTPLDLANLERAIAMAGSLAFHALETGLLVGLGAWSDKWISIQPSRGKQHLREIMTALARLPRNASQDLQALLQNAGDLIKAGSTAVLFTLRDVESVLGAGGRSSMVVLSSSRPRDQGWFQFDPAIDFGDVENA
jgi:uncharacterized protein (DUF58 family)